jgi:phospholipase A1
MKLESFSTAPRLRPSLSLALLAAACSASTFAQDMNGVEPATPAACTSIESDPARLQCYDRAMQRERSAEAIARAREEAAAYDALDANLHPNSVRNQAEERVASRLFAGELSPLDRRWELSPDSKLGTFNLRAYRPVYLLPASWSSRPNSQPVSPNPDNSVESPVDLRSVEAKFQLSLKTKVAQGVLFGEGDVWFGYTQSSRWQLYNSDISRPFRETVYEPEALLVFGTNAEAFGWNMRMVGVGVNHQSNGRSLPLSRSWNRVTAQVAFEREHWLLTLRPWWRISEDVRTDDNPDIEDYMGRGDISLVHRRGDQEFALLMRHTFRGGDESRAGLQFDWSFPLSRSLRGHVQVFDGYGESMIDYNHRATYVGLGISLFEWL